MSRPCGGFAGLGGLTLASLALVAGCGSTPRSTGPPVHPDQARALIMRLMPPAVADAQGWATDIHAAFSAMEIAPTPVNVCSVVAVTEQESGFKVDPEVAGLSKIAWREIKTQADRVNLPMAVVRALLKAPSSDGKSYAARIDAARTERELSAIFDDLVARIPLGQRFFGGRNPVRTGGPMQVSIAFAQEHVQRRPYPYRMEAGLRNEVFTRRGGLYFGTAHLLDYPARYDAPIFRFADFNAGHYASRNAGFQNALAIASGIPLELDGDLLRYGAPKSDPGTTERAARVLAKRLDLSHAAIRNALEKGRTSEFEETRLYQRVFELADQINGKPAPRAMLPGIELRSPKITRKLTTAWFARRVQQRYERCLERAAGSEGD